MTSTELPAGYESARGAFQIAMNPQPPYDTADDVSLARLTINKTFSGELEATSVVEMLSAMTSVKGSAGYVAIELFDFQGAAMDEPTDWSGQKKQLYVIAYLVLILFIIYTGRKIWLKGRTERPIPAASPATGTR